MQYKIVDIKDDIVTVDFFDDAGVQIGKREVISRVPVSDKTALHEYLVRYCEAYKNGLATVQASTACEEVVAMKGKVQNVSVAEVSVILEKAVEVDGTTKKVVEATSPIEKEVAVKEKK